MKKIACFFGTFDPVHLAHLVIAQHTKEEAGLDEVWMMISPQSPFKLDKLISEDLLRLRMMKAALHGCDGLFASDFEFNLPKPNFTVKTMEALREAYPNDQFSLLMGSDNLEGLHRWKNAREILENHTVYIYPRPGLENHLANAQLKEHDSIRLVDAPLLDISATRIRQKVSKGLSIKFLTPDAVIDVIAKEGLYQS